MRTIPVAADGVLFIVTTVVRPKIANRETGEIKTRDGQPIYQVGVCAIQGEGAQEEASAIQVAVPGEPKGLGRGMPVRFKNLVAAPWEVDGRHGISFRADGVAPVNPGRQGEPAKAA
jgi:hypothetical protein